MERLTARDKRGNVYYPHCFWKNTCGEDGGDCTECDFNYQVCNRLAEFEDREERERWRKTSKELPEGSEQFGKFYIVAIDNGTGKLYSSVRRFQRTKVRGKTVEKWIYPWDAICHDNIVYWRPISEPPGGDEKG